MSRQYVLKKFLRQAPNDLICEYLKTLDIGNDIEWKFLRQTDVDPILNAISASTPDVQEKINATFSEVNDLADSSGILTLIDVARMIRPSLELTEELACIPGNHRKVMWVLLNHPDVFAKAYKVDEFNDSRVKVILGMPALPPDWDSKSSQDKIRNSISSFYQYHEGRGEGCVVDYENVGSQHYWFVYLENYTNIELGFDESHQLDLLINRPMFSISYRYDEKDRTLEIAGIKKTERITEMRDIFTRAIFDKELLGTGNKQVFHLKQLLDADFELEPQPDLGVIGCRVKKMKINAHGRTGLTMAIEVGDHKGRKAFYDCVSNFLKTTGLSSSDASVCIVSLQLLFAPEPNSTKRKGKTHTFSVTYPDSTNLKSGPKDDIARKCLKRWQIDTNRPDGDDSSQSSYIAQTIIDV